MQTENPTAADLATDRVRGQVDQQMKQNAASGEPVTHANHTVMLHPGASALLKRISENVHEGQARVGDLMRAYKHSPNSAPALLAKYVVYRVNSLDKYDSPKMAQELDDHFMKVHQKDDAVEKNGHLRPSDLHLMLHNNIHLVKHMMKHRDMLGNMISRGVGLATREVNGQPYVALHRSVFAPTKHDHSLVSFSEGETPAVGLHQMHLWVPVKDIWFAYNAAPKWVSGSLGPEDEYLVSNSGEKFTARHDDITPSRFKDVPEDYYSIDGKTPHGPMPELLNPILNDANDSQTALLIPNHSWLVGYYGQHPDNMGPLTYQAIKQHHPNLVHNIMHSPGVPREDAMENLKYQATTGRLTDTVPLRNPNLTTGDLAHVISSINLFVGPHAHYALHDIVDHPKYTEDTARLLLDKAQVVAKALVEEGMDDKASSVLADAFSTVLSSRHPHKFAQNAVLSGLVKDRQWAIDALQSITKADSLTPEFGDRLFRSSFESRNRNPGAWVGYDYATPARSLPLSNTLLKELVDIDLQKQDATRIATPQQVARILDTIGGSNPYLDPSSAQILAKSPTALSAMINRKDWIPPSVQVAFTKYPNIEWRKLASRQDLSPEATHSLLEQLRFMDPGPNAIAEARIKYGEIMQPVISELSINPQVSWQTLWGAVKAKNVAAPKIIQQLKAKAPERYMPQFSYKEGSVFEAELLNAIVRKRLHERAEGAEEIVPPRELPRRD